jgi:catechol 2,3-dioxygenase-like lactoylglutathione lyase family enzyme
VAAECLLSSLLEGAEVPQYTRFALQLVSPTRGAQRTMNDNLYARSVFFVEDAERSLRFYTERLGFSLDWNYEEEGRTIVFQVSLFGFELILNQVFESTQARPGHGRLFIGLGEDQGERVLQHLLARSIQAEFEDWGRPTLVIKDIDGNEIFIWGPGDDWTRSALAALESNRVTEPVK